MELTGDAHLPDPLKIADFDVGVRGLSLPEPGKYWVILKADGEIISQRPFTVTEAKEAEDEK